MTTRPTLPTMTPEMPLRKFRLALGLTTSNAGQYSEVSRKTWEAGEVAGKAAPMAAVVLVYSKLERICDADKRNDPSAEPREIVMVLKMVDHAIGYQVPSDSVASDIFLGVEEATEPGTVIIKSMAVAWGTGRPYVHRTTYVQADNAHVERFASRHHAELGTITTMKSRHQEPIDPAGRRNVSMQENMMRSGSTLAVEDAEDQYREDAALRIATDAVELVAARDMDRVDAVHEVTAALRRSNEANNDVTGVLVTMLSAPKPSKAKYHRRRRSRPSRRSSWTLRGMPPIRCRLGDPPAPIAGERE